MSLLLKAKSFKRTRQSSLVFSLLPDDVQELFWMTIKKEIPRNAAIRACKEMNMGFTSDSVYARFCRLALEEMESDGKTPSKSSGVVFKK
jgi:hypothetical protein